MKYLNKQTLLLSGLAALMSQVADAQVLVYDNSDFKLGSAYSSPNEFGDQINLGGTARQLTRFTFSYTATGLSGDETVTLRFYRNDGPIFVGSGNPSPGSLMFAPVTDPLPATGAAGGTLSYDLTSFGSIIADNTLTWTVSFGGVAGAEVAQLNIYNPPDIGTNPDSYWEHNGVLWQENLLNGGATPANFGAQLEAVPEPSTVALGLIGLGILGMSLRRKA